MIMQNTNEACVCPTSISHQCAWCTAVTDGTHAGELFFLEVGGTLHLHRLQDYSHVLCPHCHARQRGLWERKQMRKRLSATVYFVEEEQCAN